MESHFPNTYMEQFCKALHPDLELDSTCVSWFRHAVHHCTELMNDVRPPTSYIWKTVKNFIFPERNTELQSPMIPIGVHPNRLTMQDCQSLFLDIVQDYVLRAPRYAAESTTNAMLWQIIQSIIGILTLGSFLLATVFISKKYGKVYRKRHLLEDFFKPEKRLAAVAKRSLRLAKAEVRQLQVEPILKPEDLIAPDGTSTLVLKVATKFDFINSIVNGSTQTSGRLYRLYDQLNKPNSEIKTQSLNNALNFLGNNTQKLRLLIIFAEDAIQEGDAISEVEGKILQSKLPQSQSPTTRSPRLNQRFQTPTRDIAANCGIPSTNWGFGSNTPRSGSEKKVPTPRSGTPPSSIPRNISKRSPQTVVKRFK